MRYDLLDRLLTSNASLKRLLNDDLAKTFTDFAGNQFAFADAFVRNTECGTPIRNMLELGINKPRGGFPLAIYGQSTKTLLVLGTMFFADTLVSLDIDDCKVTTDFCYAWAEEHLAPHVPRVETVGSLWKSPHHRFVQANSLDFTPEQYFVPPGQVFAGLDLIFLDTNHDDSFPESKLGYKNSGGAGMTYKEICHYAPFLSRNGRLFLHDTKHYYVPRGYGVNTEGAIQRFIDENKDFKFREHDTNAHGLGEIVRADADVW